MKTKTCIIAILLTVGLTSSRAQDTWTQKADFGGTARVWAVGFSIGSKGYIGTGNDESGPFGYVKDFWEYDPATNAWTQKADFGGGDTGFAVGFSIGSKGYIGTGTFGGNDFWEYDPATNAWTQKADFGGTARWVATGFSIGDKGYIGTGEDFSGFVTKEFWEYDPATNAWTQKADFGGTARDGAVGFSIGSKGYIGTGVDRRRNVHKDFWEYDPATNAWTQKADFGGTARDSAVGFSLGSKGYIGAGCCTLKDFWEYDPATNTWTQKADVGGTARNGSVGFSIDSKGYIGTGLDPFDFTRKDFWEYTPDSGTGDLTLMSAASRVTHGLQGSFDIPLPLTGNVGVECRAGVSNDTIVMTFNNIVTGWGPIAVECAGFVGISVDPSDGHNLLLTIDGTFCDGSVVTVEVFDVQDDQGNTLSGASASVGLLLGDVTGDGHVKNGDVSQVQAFQGQHADASNFRNDVTLDGRINRTDTKLVKSKRGHSLP